MVDRRAELFGASYPAALPDNGFGVVGSLNWGTWIQARPDSRTLPLGSIRPGDVLPLVSAEPKDGVGGVCSSFARVKEGFVCTSRRATLDANSRWIQAGRWTEPVPGPLPYEFAISWGAPMLSRVPRREEFRWTIGERPARSMRGWAAGHDHLADTVPIAANGPIPDFLKDGGSVPTSFATDQKPGLFFKRIPEGSMLAYTRAFEAEGETWVLSTNMMIVPARGLARFRPSQFHGVELHEGLTLPVAWFRTHERPRWTRTEQGFEPAATPFAVRTMAKLTGQEERRDHETYWETGDGSWVKASDATRVEPVKKLPWEVKDGGRWIYIGKRRGILVLYDGLTPVFTTLISPGKKGATPPGRFRIESKHRTTTMTNEMGEPTRFWIADVPWTQYFDRPYALHTAYWHENFGEEMSGGCVNLSPLDAKRLFAWTDPPLPEGWESAQAIGATGGTFVLIEM